MGDFQKGTKIGLKMGGEATIIEKLGEGGQGAVYRVLCDNTEYALKWYTVGILPPLSCVWFAVTLARPMPRSIPSVFALP